MNNEILLILTLVCEYTCVVAAYKIFGKTGLMAWTVIATLLSNIEVLILVDAFGMEMTLGNVLFATTFLVTDVLSEMYGKKDATTAVYLGIAASLVFMCVSYSWMQYLPSENDFAFSSMEVIFSNTPRLIIASLSVYAISQIIDVKLYHKWWEFTEKKTGDKRSGLWLRNNGSTLISQLINAVLYNIFAFAGIYDTGTLISIIFSTYVIYIVTSLCDTPFVYWCRKIGSN